ncbi:hypothetical protein [Anaerohalosphaera lusitana]|uniref:hypothetical protein n=1 Tax=Anaerohalosphaera lusitana TaxID=1936003 RepID=UPI0014759406|nr:hypothetical protein [Anaerohalosphaera lusitana]
MKAGIAKSIAFLFLVAFGLCFVYRVSEVHGPEAKYGCGLAIVVTVSTSFVSVLPVLFAIASGFFVVGIAAIIGSVVRLFLTVIGFIIVAAMGMSNGWFFLFGSLFYLVFLLIETLLALRLMKKEADY